MSSLKLLKFDVIHPHTYLVKKRNEWNDLDDLSAAQYRDRLISLRSNYSDFYTHYLNELGWKAEDFFLNDATYLSPNKLFLADNFFKVYLTFNIICLQIIPVTFLTFMMALQIAWLINL